MLCGLVKARYQSPELRVGCVLNEGWRAAKQFQLCLLVRVSDEALLEEMAAGRKFLANVHVAGQSRVCAI